MREFRFPKFAILLMIVCLFAVVSAIGFGAELSRTLQMNYRGPLTPIWWLNWWFKLPGSFIVLFMALWTVGAAGYAIVFAFQRSGLHRLTSLEPRPPR